MDTTAAIPEQTIRAAEPRRSPLLRVSVPAIVFVGSAALIWAGWLCGGAVLVAGFLAGLAAAGLAVLWLYRPHLGGTLLIALGSGATAAAGVSLLTGGSVPWLLVAFWGGSAILLGAILDLVAGPGADRAAVVALVAVVSLLILSGVGLTAYVSETWTAAEQSALQNLPIIPKAQLAVAQRLHMEPVTGGEWGAHWALRADDPRAEFDKMRALLVSDGWTVTDTAPMALTAEKRGFQVQLTERPTPASASAPAASSEASAVAKGAYIIDVTAHVLAKGDSSAKK
jgi:hypothetical protein